MYTLIAKKKIGRIGCAVFFGTDKKNFFTPKKFDPLLKVSEKNHGRIKRRDGKIEAKIFLFLIIFVPFFVLFNFSSLFVSLFLVTTLQTKLKQIN